MIEKLMAIPWKNAVVTYYACMYVLVNTGRLAPSAVFKSMTYSHGHVINFSFM